MAELLYPNLGSWIKYRHLTAMDPAASRVQYVSISLSLEQKLSLAGRGFLRG